MKNIYIIFSFSGTYFSRFLKTMSGDKEKYIHVSISLDDKFKNVYSFGRKNPRWMFPAGFVMEDFKKVTKFFKGSICKVYKLPVTKNNQAKLLKELKKYIDEEKEYRYNIKGLIHIKLNKIYHRSHHFVCSQFVGKLLQDSNIYDFKKDYSLIRPVDINKIPNLEVIYEGKIIDLIKKIEDEQN